MRGARSSLSRVGFYRFWLATDIRRHLWSNTTVGRRRARIHRHREGTAHRLPVRARDPGADLPRLFSHRPRSGAAAGLRQHPARPVLLPVRPVRHLSRAPLPADPHGLARRALLDGRLGRELCVARRSVDASRRTDARPCAAVGAGLARTLQDAPHGIRRPARQLRGHRRRSCSGGLWWLWLLAVAISLPPHSAALHLRAPFSAIEWRWWVSGIRIGEVRFKSDLRDGALIGLYWKVIGWSVLLVIGLRCWVGIAFAIGYASTQPADPAEQKFFPRVPADPGSGLRWLRLCRRGAGESAPSSASI